MGVHINVQGVDGVEHPEWNWIRQAGDSDIAVEVFGHPHDSSQDVHGEPLARPKDVGAFVARMVVAHPGGRDRWELLGRILSDPRWWLYFSW